MEPSVFLLVIVPKFDIHKSRGRLSPIFSSSSTRHSLAHSEEIFHLTEVKSLYSTGKGFGIFKTETS